MNLAESHIHHGEGATVFAGPKAVDVFRLITLKSAIKLYMKTGIRPNRYIGPTLMLKQAGLACGQVYGRGEFARAVSDLEAVIAQARGSIPETSAAEMEGAL